MDHQPTLKEQLPSPYDRDLSPVLTRLNRVTSFAQKRLANDPVTAAYIAAAMRLVRHHLGPDATHRFADPEDDDPIARPLLGFLSQRAVAAEGANNPDPFPKVGSVATLRSRWKSQSDFLADLMAFAGWSRHIPEEHDDLTATVDELLDGPNFVEAAHALAYWDTATLVRSPRIRLGFVMAASADGDEAIREIYARSVRETLEPWKEIYAAVIRNRELQLRDGITIDDFTDILSALSHGIILRAIADPGSGVLDHERQRSLVGKGALALFLGCLQHASSGDGMTLEEAVEAVVYGQSQIKPDDRQEVARSAPYQQRPPMRTAPGASAPADTLRPLQAGLRAPTSAATPAGRTGQNGRS
jgi:hypothetical protein